MSLRITLSTVTSMAAVAERWRELEGAADGGVFRSWAWVGCLAEQRYDDPLLLVAEDGGGVAALGLFNRRGRALWLGQTGDPAWDCVFVEHNGLLLRRDAPPGLAASCLAVAMRARLDGAAARRCLQLGGVGAEVLAAARNAGWTAVRQQRDAPFVDLARIAAEGGDYLRSRSANTRQQLRRSVRRFAAMGPLRVERAADAAERVAFLDALAMLHQTTWRDRGQPGAFATGHFARFHRALVTQDGADAYVDLLRVLAGKAVLGYLYNLRHAGRVFAYQGGFDYALADTQRKPGLTSHHLAIERALAHGMHSYDFGAGAQRYKLDLSNARQTLFWAEAAPRWSVAGAAMRLRRG